MNMPMTSAAKKLEQDVKVATSSACSLNRYIIIGSRLCTEARMVQADNRRAIFSCLGKMGAGSSGRTRGVSAIADCISKMPYGHRAAGSSGRGCPAPSFRTNVEEFWGIGL